MKTRILEYKAKNPKLKKIVDPEIIQFLDRQCTFIQLDSKQGQAKQRAAAFLLGMDELPRCYCGNAVPFNTKKKELTPYGGWNTYCSTDCMRKDPELNEIKKQTKIKRFGKAGVGSTEKWSEEKKAAYKEKVRNTNLKKRGVEHHSQTKEYLEKRTATNLERYGVENTWALVKNPATPFFATDAGKKFLRENNPNNPDKARQTKLLKRTTPEMAQAIMNNDKSLFKELIFALGDVDRYRIAEHFNLSVPFVNNLFRQFDMREFNRRKDGPEREIHEFLKSIGVDSIIRDRLLLPDGKEIDVLVPGKLAIEYDGLWTHGESVKGKDYHRWKHDNCPIPMLHILDCEWDNPIKRKIWKSIITHKLGLTPKKISARKTEVRQIHSSIAREFFEANHLEGFVGANYHLALYHGEDLVSAISIGKSRFKKDENEIIRYATKIDTLVNGGLSKLLSKVDTDNLYTFANRRYSGRSYGLVGEYLYTTGPNWYGFNKSNGELHHRFKFQKHRLAKLFPNFDETKTAYENMLANGYDRYWDCGSDKYRIK